MVKILTEEIEERKEMEKETHQQRGSTPRRREGKQEKIIMNEPTIPLPETPEPLTPEEEISFSGGWHAC